MSDGAESSKKGEDTEKTIEFGKRKFVVISRSDFRGSMRTEAKLEWIENTIIQDRNCQNHEK